MDIEKRIGEAFARAYEDVEVTVAAAHEPVDRTLAALTDLGDYLNGRMTAGEYDARCQGRGAR